jgi:hypothetical protein
LFVRIQLSLARTPQPHERVMGKYRWPAVDACRNPPLFAQYLHHLRLTPQLSLVIADSNVA